MIYLIKIKDHDLCKIGFTVSIEKKLKTFRTYCPFDVDFYHLRDGGYTHEGNMHWIARNHWVRDEWFRFSPELLHVFNTAELYWNVGRPKNWRKVVVSQKMPNVPELRSYQIRAVAAERAGDGA